MDCHRKLASLSFRVSQSICAYPNSNLHSAIVLPLNIMLKSTANKHAFYISKLKTLDSYRL